jgi:hypothetical protein
LPQRFFEMSPKDVAQADCIIIMGTSLAVKPFSECCSAMRVDHTRDGLACVGELPQRVGPLVPRLLMNMTGVAKEAGLRLGEVTQFTAPSSPFICVSQLRFRMAPLFQATTETCLCSANLKTLFRFFAAWLVSRCRSPFTRRSQCTKECVSESGGSVFN